MRALLAEDDEKLGRLVKNFLEEENFSADWVKSGAEALYYASNAEYDIVILDWMMPDGEGIDVCRKLRERKVQTGILMLTARDTVEDRVVGLDVGADDYLVKPFAFAELMARIRSVLRRSEQKFQEELLQVLGELKIETKLIDERATGDPLLLNFQGTLHPEQQLAADQLIKHDIGVLSASTAFGKTVIGAWLIAQRKVNTLVIVHRRQLMDQWVESLQSFLGLGKKDIGQIGGGKHKVTGTVDVAMIQSLINKGTVNDLVGNYGHIIVDECHHISAASFEQVIRQAKARFITGLSATVTRKDGHHPIIFMQCGPVRYRVDDRQQAALRSFTHRVIVRKTNFVLPSRADNAPEPGIQEVYAMLAADFYRNQMIVDDVVEAVHNGRSPVLLTERREHLTYFADTLAGKVKNIIVLSGGMGRKQRILLMDQLKNIPEDEERLIIATGRYLGEGFDDARLDTLFLALPIAWRGTVAQYAGRLHRNYDRKSEVIIYDYVDDQVPVLAGMFGKRKKGYKAIGYEL